MEYDPAHKTSSVTSTSSNTSSIWDPLPSLYYTGRAESVSSSAFEFDEPDSFLDEGYLLYEKKKDKMMVTLSEDPNTTDFLDSFLCGVEEEQPKSKKSHEEPSSSDVCHGRKRYHDQVEEKSKNREILTNDQKRANHIASEQKRRNTIRGGFKELTELIPTLKNINHSKSTILFKSVDYIKKLEKGNKVLKERLTILQSRVQQKLQYQQYKRQQQQQQQQQQNNHHLLPPNTIAALLIHKNQQKQLELLQEQLRLQQALLSKHHLFTNYHSISIPAMDDTPTTSTHNSPTLSHASSSLVNINSISSFHNALVIPLNNHSSAPSFTIPADEENYHINHYSERLLTSGKLDHLKKY